jgi:excisionase family DNA binding protein
VVSKTHLEALVKTRFDLENQNVHANTTLPSIKVIDANAYICLYSFMPKVINGRSFYTTSEVAKMADIHRLTLLRWIREGKLADVHRDRNGWRLFSEESSYRVAEFAKGINSRSSPNQGLLFPRGSLQNSNTFHNSVLKICK